jgi:fumarate hydratase class II
MMNVTYREEQDSMGVVKVPEEAYYGAQTERARSNFQISDLRFPRSFYKALGLIKKHSASVNLDLGLLDRDLADPVIQACEEVISGRFDDQFIVDVFQTGSGTSTNMNTNEVIAGRANEKMTGKRGGKSPVHPNDHVNKGQSSNDVIPSAIHISALIEFRENLLPAMKILQTALDEKAKEFEDVRKIARTHLQDAVPISLGQIFSGYARQVEMNIQRITGLENNLGELALGGTAVGTGVNTHPEFAEKVIKGIAEETGCPFREAENHFEAQAARDTAVEASGALKTYAVSLVKIANDIRFLSSGPRCGLGEIVIPDMQPGSSIMPGKVNPVIPEAVIQVAGQVIGNDAAISFGGQAGNFELNVMLPLIAYNLLQSIQILSSCSTHFAEKCVMGILANHDKCTSSLEKSLSLATAFVPEVGYDQSAALAKEAYQTGKTVREVAKENKILSDDKIDEVLDRMINGK